LKGVDPVLEGQVTDLERTMKQGSLSALTEEGEDDRPGILLGQDLAQQLGASIGDEVTLITPGGSLSPMGLMPRNRRVRVAGLFQLGLYEYDSAYGFVSLDFAKRLLSKDAPDLIQLRVNDIWAAADVARAIPQQFGPEYVAEDWSELNRSLFSALWLEKMAISITIGLIMTVAAVNIVASLVLLVMEKSKDIAILKTMGTSTASIRRIFMLQGLIIGCAGTLAGTIGGCLIIYLLDRFKAISVPIDVYQISYIPFELLWTDLLFVVAAAIVICFAATIYPARQAAKLDPAQGLRYQ
jgi:lipoprotein-releasing system permease protein